MAGAVLATMSKPRGLTSRVEVVGKWQEMVLVDRSNRRLPCVRCIPPDGSLSYSKNKADITGKQGWKQKRKSFNFDETQTDDETDTEFSTLL